MNQNGKAYEPPKVKIYRFDHNDLILTASGEDTLVADYAANTLNQLFNGTTTTIEK